MILTPGKLMLELVFAQQNQKTFIFMGYAAYQEDR